MNQTKIDPELAAVLGAVLRTTGGATEVLLGRVLR